jgi:hypothetical protein
MEQIENPIVQPLSEKEINKNFDDAETELLREALKRSYKERFLRATQLYKVHQTMKKMKITHQHALSRLNHT